MPSPIAHRIGPRRRLGVDLLGTANLVGALGKYLGIAALLPAGVALVYGEPLWPFLAAGAITSGFGLVLERLTAGSAAGIGAREGFLVVAVTWLLAATFGALPYLFSGEKQFADPVDAYFEAMSGFTTTGSSILTDVEALPNSMLLWRALTQWLGGMGIIVLALAVLPRLRVGGRQLLESEMPGPEVEALGERIRHTAQRLWILYVAITALEVLALSLLAWTGVDEQMDFFKAVAHAFTTLPSGGFSTEAKSIEAFSPATQWVIAFFMFVAGTNFALMYRAIVRRHPRVLPQDEEFRLYVALVTVAIVVLTVELWTENVLKGEAAVRTGVFQVLTIHTSTGYSTANFDTWPVLTLMLLVLLMFIGGSAGSTSGSVKVIRHLLMGRILRRELQQTVHPEIVQPVRFNKVVVDERTLRAVSSFVLLYMGVFVVGAGLIAIDTARSNLPLGALDIVACVATTMANTGPGLGVAGPYGSFEPFSDFSKLVFIGLMWVGRLELIPVLVLLTRNYWRA